MRPRLLKKIRPASGRGADGPRPALYTGGDKSRKALHRHPRPAPVRRTDRRTASGASPACPPKAEVRRGAIRRRPPSEGGPAVACLLHSPGGHHARRNSVGNGRGATPLPPAAVPERTVRSPGGISRKMRRRPGRSSPRRSLRPGKTSPRRGLGTGPHPSASRGRPPSGHKAWRTNAGRGFGAPCPPAYGTRAEKALATTGAVGRSAVRACGRRGSRTAAGRFSALWLPKNIQRARRCRARCIQPSCCRYQHTVRRMPSSRPTRGCQPSSCRMRPVSMA